MKEDKIHIFALKQLSILSIYCDLLDRSMSALFRFRHHSSTCTWLTLLFMWNISTIYIYLAGF